MLRAGYPACAFLGSGLRGSYSTATLINTALSSATAGCSPRIVLAHLTPTQRRAYVLADNKLALNAGWDLEMLSLEIGELGEAGFDLSLTGFDEFELGELFAERTQGRTDPDDAPEPPVHPVAEPGDLWVLGRHRLLCGDSTVATDVERVLGGVAPHLMVTDPP